MASFNLSILTPESQATESAVDSLVAPGLKGSFGVLSGHAPMIAALQRGILRAEARGRALYFVVGEGVLEVRRNEVVVLTGSVVEAASLREAEAMLIA
jgi:F-type H+-transporting ATPase subunit epsilon